MTLWFKISLMARYYESDYGYKIQLFLPNALSINLGLIKSLRPDIRIGSVLCNNNKVIEIVQKKILKFDFSNYL